MADRGLFLVDLDGRLFVCREVGGVVVRAAINWHRYLERVW